MEKSVFGRGCLKNPIHLILSRRASAVSKDALSTGKAPPLPPLVRGARKSKTPSTLRRRIAFSYPPDKGLLKNPSSGGSLLCRGRIYATRPFCLPTTGRIYAAPTLPSARRNPIAVIPILRGLFQQTLVGPFANRPYGEEIRRSSESRRTRHKPLQRKPPHPPGRYALSGGSGLPHRRRSFPPRQAAS